MAPPGDLGALLPILRCPYCQGGFAFDERPRPELGRAEFGTLRCRCSTFPVVDGIPVIQRAPVCMLEHTRGKQETDGIAIEALVALVERGDTLDALLACVAVPEIPASWRSALGWRLSHSGVVKRAADARVKRRFVKEVLAARDVIGAREVLEHYYLSGGPLSPEMGHYFIRRAGQPRHLAALAMAATIASESKPILDIACGIGNLEHYFGSRHDPAAVVGLDMNFYHLWIAKHWMAPSASYVCANASDGLPFRDDSFGATVCSDAYHYIRNPARLLSEIERCAPERMVVLTRVGNASVRPNEGIERSLEKYLAEIGTPARTFDEASLLKCYLARANAFALPLQQADVLRDAKWLTFAWNVEDRPPRTLATDSIAPHAVGRLGINPIYTQAPLPNGAMRLQFEFPLVWFAYENNAMLSYHPRSVTLSGDQLETMASGRTGPSVQTLIDSFVMIGFPDRFSSRAM